jgi:hypothetical protein
MTLNNCAATVAIHNQPGQPIALGMHNSKSGSLRVIKQTKRSPDPKSLLNALSQQSLFALNPFEREHADRYTSGPPVTTAKIRTVFGEHIHQTSTLNIPPALQYSP